MITAKEAHERSSARRKVKQVAYDAIMALCEREIGFATHRGDMCCSVQIDQTYVDVACEVIEELKRNGYFAVCGGPILIQWGDPK